MLGGDRSLHVERMPLITFAQRHTLADAPEQHGPEQHGPEQHSIEQHSISQVIGQVVGHVPSGATTGRR
ncbi:MAG TPA: hypothetical protein VGL26_01130 [Jatrophihabitans sp.]